MKEFTLLLLLLLVAIRAQAQDYDLMYWNCHDIANAAVQEDPDHRGPVWCQPWCLAGRSRPWEGHAVYYECVANVNSDGTVDPADLCTQICIATPPSGIPKCCFKNPSGITPPDLSSGDALECANRICGDGAAAPEAFPLGALLAVTCTSYPAETFPNDYAACEHECQVLADSFLSWMEFYNQDPRCVDIHDFYQECLQQCTFASQGFTPTATTV
jgi:hypothetical protein